jgi:hypothetical protein
MCEAASELVSCTTSESCKHAASESTLESGSLFAGQVMDEKGDKFLEIRQIRKFDSILTEHAVQDPT